MAAPKAILLDDQAEYLADRHQLARRKLAGKPLTEEEEERLEYYIYDDIIEERKSDESEDISLEDIRRELEMAGKIRPTHAKRTRRSA